VAVILLGMLLHIENERLLAKLIWCF